MNQEKKPDTTKAVAQYIEEQKRYSGEPASHFTESVAFGAIAVHDKELARCGWMTVKIGAPVPWMLGSVIHHAHELCDETCPRGVET